MKPTCLLNDILFWIPEKDICNHYTSLSTEDTSLQIFKNISILNSMGSILNQYGLTKNVIFDSCKLGYDSYNLPQKPVEKNILFENCIFLNCDINWYDSYGENCIYIDCIFINPVNIEKNLRFNIKDKCREYLDEYVNDESTESFIERFSTSTFYLVE